MHHQPPAEEPDIDYPLYLATGRILAEYQSGTQTRRIANLTDLAPEPLVEMHPATARRCEVSDGDQVNLAAPLRVAKFKLRVTSNFREDTVFVSFHWGGEQAANRLTNPALDPISRMPEFKVCAVRIERYQGTKEVTG